MEFKDFNTGHFGGINSLYRRMIEEIQDYAIILLDREGMIRNWNNGAEKIKLYSESEILGKHFSIFYFPEDIENKLPQKLLNIADVTGKVSHEGWRRRKDGTRFWGNVTITAIHDDNDEVIGFCKVTRDLTLKKLAEDRLRVSEERYHRMIAEVQDYAIILLDVNGLIGNWNIGAEKIKGYRADEVIGKRFDIFYTEEDKWSHLPDKLLNQAKETGKALQEGWRVRKDGTKFWGTIVITALHNEKGEVIGFSKVTRDLTVQKLADEKLKSYTAELEIQNRDLEQFAYVASHDLQEPLRKIQTFSDVIQENIEDREFVKLYFGKLNNSARRMTELIKSLLNYSRLSKDKNPYEDVDLNMTLEHVRQDFELLISEKHAKIISDELPVIKGNSTQLGQLFANLISNSLKFSTSTPEIRITAGIIDRSDIANVPDSLSDERYHLINFEDNGIGFEQQYDKLIFSLFQRLHGKLDYSGTGIGLSLCKRIVENHNGFIAAESEPGKGAQFRVYLPFVEEQAAR